jgi:hypothetical protein
MCFGMNEKDTTEPMRAGDLEIEDKNVNRQTVMKDVVSKKGDESSKCDFE